MPLGDFQPEKKEASKLHAALIQFHYEGKILQNIYIYIITNKIDCFKKIMLKNVNQIQFFKKYTI